MSQPSIVWFRDDLRLADNPALRAAIDRGEPIIALYVLDEESEGIRPLGGAAKWWLHGSLTSLGERLDARGGGLVLRRGPAGRVVREVASETDAGAVFWNRRYGGAERAVDADLKDGLRTDGLTVESFAASVLFEPWTVRTGSGTPYSVFTPFWRACQAMPAPRAPLPEPREVAGPSASPASDDLGEWMLLPASPDWAGGLRETWEPGEPAARARLREFLADDLGTYDDSRDEPATGSTSRLSPYLRWGEISPYTVWHETAAARGTGAHATSAGRFLSEIGWREFATHTLFHFPDLATKNLRAEFDAFPWPRLTPTQLEAWQQGRTGVPLVDAGMRELWHTGVMHNRIRMVTASFLIKNLLIDWRRRRAVVLGHARRRRRRQQPVQLAVGGRVGSGCRALLPGLQPRTAGQEVRPTCAVHPRVGAGVLERRGYRCDRGPRRDAQACAGRVRGDAAHAALSGLVLRVWCHSAE